MHTPHWFRGSRSMRCYLANLQLRRVFADFLALMKDGWVPLIRDVTGDIRVYTRFTSSFEYMRLLLHTMISTSKDCMSRPLRETLSYCIHVYPILTLYQCGSGTSVRVKHPWVARVVQVDIDIILPGHFITQLDCAEMVPSFDHALYSLLLYLNLVLNDPHTSFWYFLKRW